jgi:hypothetical protein
MISETRTSTAQHGILVCAVILFGFWLIGHSTAEPTVTPVKDNRRNQSISTVNQRGGQNIIAGGDVHLGPQPRTISAQDRTAFKALVATAPKGRVELGHMSSDPETYAFAKQLVELLNEAGYKAAITMTYGAIASIPPAVGIYVDVRDGTKPPAFALPLREGLVRINIDNKGKVDEGLPDDCIRINVFPKP